MGYSADQYQMLRETWR